MLIASACSRPASQSSPAQAGARRAAPARPDSGRSWSAGGQSPASKRARERHAYYCVGQAPRQLVGDGPARTPRPIARPGARFAPRRRSERGIGLCAEPCCYGVYLCDEVRRGKRATADERSWCATARPPPPPR